MNIKVEIEDLDAAVLQNDLLDVEEWLRKAVDGKIKQSKKRLLAAWIPKMMADTEVQSLPADEKGLIALILRRSDYKSRKTMHQEERPEQK